MTKILLWTKRGGGIKLKIFFAFVMYKLVYVSIVKLYPDAAFEPSASTKLSKSPKSSRTFTACPRRVTPGLAGQSSARVARVRGTNGYNFDDAGDIFANWKVYLILPPCS